MPAEPLAIAARPPGDRSWWSARGWYHFLFWSNALIILGFWWRASGSQPAHGLAGELNALGRLAGLFGTYLALWQILLMSRLPWLHEAFGTEQLTVVHRWNGYLTLGLLVMHAVLQTIGYQLTDGMGMIGQVADFFASYDGLLAATAGLLILVVVVGISIAIARKRLAYETWYFVHLYTYIGIALAFSHELAVGADFSSNLPFVVYWCVLYVIVAACLIGARVLLPLVRFARHRFRVGHVQREAPNVVSIYITGRRLEEFPFVPGQFLLWRFLDGQRWWEAHPYSLSIGPNGKYLRLTVKGVGDFSRRLARVRQGTPVLVEGPFGHFTAGTGTRPKALLVAGGVGVTPLRAMAEALAAQGLDVCFLYRCRDEREIVFRQELDQAARATGMRVAYLLDSNAPGGSGRNWFHPYVLKQVVPDVHRRDVYVCGPPGMTASLRSALRELGVGRGQFHTEAFRF